MADEYPPYADPWGLPQEDSPSPPPSNPVSEPEQTPEAVAEPANEPESVPEAEPETEATDAEPAPAVEDDIDDASADEEPEESVVGDDTGKDDLAVDEDAGAALTEDEGTEEPADAIEEELAAETAPEAEASDETIEGDQPEVMISPAHMEAKNVLDTLGAEFEDLPEEPPEWMEESPATTPPRVYGELTELDRPAVFVPGASAEPFGEETSEVQAGEDNALDQPADLADEAAPADQVDDEQDLDEAVASALSAVEPDDDLRFESDLGPLEETSTEEPISEEVPVGESDIDSDLASALSAVQPDEESSLSPELPGDLSTDDVTDDTNDFDSDLASPLSAFGSDDGDEDTDFTEFGPQSDVDLQEVIASAISAVHSTDEDADTVSDDVWGLGDTEGPPDHAEEWSFAETDIAETDEPSPEPTDEPAEPESETVVESPSVAWGSNWSSAAQGWIRHDGERSIWRPIVTTTSAVGTWEVDTFLGIVAGDSSITDSLGAARKAAVQAMVDEALSRGAHAVVGVRMSFHETSHGSVCSAIGTAVTLRDSR